MMETVYRGGLELSDAQCYSRLTMTLGPKIGFLLLLFMCANSHAMDQETKDQSLRQAAQMGSTKLIRAALDDGAKIEGTTTYGQTALHYAALSGHQKAVQLLLDRGANPNVSDDRDLTPLHFAAFNCNNRAVDVLLKADANPNRYQHHGQTPLIQAAVQGCVQVVALLLMQKGIDVSHRDDHGKTALDHARLEGVADVGGPYGQIIQMINAFEKFKNDGKTATDSNLRP